MAELNSENFCLKFIICKEIEESANCYISVSGSDGNRYSGEISFLCPKVMIRSFFYELKWLYETLKEGSATICEDYEPDDNFIGFISDGMGHFTVKGVFNNWCKWTLKFEETCDQTYLKKFVRELEDEIKKLS
ncbi:MAG: hypothetical protein ACI4MH_02135 [Candidatus Coproplasma sp.]